MESLKPVLKPFGLADIVPTFNLIQEACRHGHFTDLYLQPRFRAGLGIQLFTLLIGRIRLPDRIWYQAQASVLMMEGGFAGFVIIRHMPSESEIYMCALLPEFRGKGLGKLMLAEALAAYVARGRRVIADCFPASQPMRIALERLGFRSEKPVTPAAVKRFFLIWPGSKNPAQT